ncbi:hypothetical protein DH2020_005030 [Rehmannia glutinosa]|uniref:Glycosyltransferase N-terminal domain-containing protein n=1 Tax=Rehmannia glutinosa TaxID=99300 RepID=A0ABR0XRA5_REHGL
MEQRHVLLVTFPAQGHINPSLQFAKRLTNMGIDVTFATSVYARRRMAKTTAGDLPKGLTFASFSDGYDDGFKPSDDANKYMTEIRSQGSKALKDTILAAAEQGRPVTCLVYTLLLPWAPLVARELHIPSALLWIQPATVMDIYYYYFNGFGDEIMANSNDPSWKIQFPGNIPLLSKRDLPSFMLSSSSDRYSFALPTFKEQLDTLEAEVKPKVLVNTFDALEANAIKAIDRYDLIGIGPLIPSAFLDDGGDCERAIRTGRPFLWVIRLNENANQEKTEDVENLSCLDELEKIGKIVAWCSQLEVLTHPSLGCFVSHCGWNSTLRAYHVGFGCGVPALDGPGTNAKLIEDVWGTGVRVRVNEDRGMVESGEIRRCIEEVMDGGEKSRELRENAEKWKRLAREAMEENGSSNRNLKAFLEEVGDGC